MAEQTVHIPTMPSRKTRGIQFWCFLLLLLAGAVMAAFLTVLLSKVHYARSAYPLLTERTAFYAEFRPQILQDFRIVQTLAQFGAEVSNEEHDSALFLAEQVAPYAEGGMGMMVQDDQLFFFLPVSIETANYLKEQEFILSDGQGLSMKYQVSIIEKQGLFAVIGAEPFLLSGDYPVWLAQEKLTLAQMQEQKSGIWYFHAGQHPALKGFVANEGIRLTIHGALDGRFSVLESSLEPNTPFFLNQRTQSNGMIRFPALSFFPPGTLTVFSGTFTDLQQKPFSNDSRWQWKGDPSSAGPFQQEILEQLATAYPQSELRQLPDESSVFELKRDPTPFVSHPEQSMLTTLLTYPDGQISIRDDEGMTSFEHLDAAAALLDETENTCLLPNSLVHGHASGDFLEEELWKTLNFSWNAEEFVICVSFHS